MTRTRVLVIGLLAAIAIVLTMLGTEGLAAQIEYPQPQTRAGEPWNPDV